MAWDPVSCHWGPSSVLANICKSLPWLWIGKQKKSPLIHLNLRMNPLIPQSEGQRTRRKGSTSIHRKPAQFIWSYLLNCGSSSSKTVVRVRRE